MGEKAGRRGRGETGGTWVCGWIQYPKEQALEGLEVRKDTWDP